MSFIVKRVDPIDTVAQQAVQFEIDQLFEPPSFYFPTAEPGGQYQSCQLFQRKQCFKGKHIYIFSRWFWLIVFMFRF